jgi:hypothetical protein
MLKVFCTKCYIYIFLFYIYLIFLLHIYICYLSLHVIFFVGKKQKFFFIYFQKCGVHMYEKTCMYVHMCCVLIRPPIPYITSSRYKKDLINFVLKSFCFIKGLTQGSPLVTNLIIYVFKIYQVITSYFF